jgi:hypothetical protein
MSGINASPLWAPPCFPAMGRLPDTPDQVQANVDLQYREEKEHKLALNAQNGLSNVTPCCKSLHISLFFDGTNNNERASSEAARPNPSNIARLYHAALEDIDSGYYRYYMPGVGTAFPEIGELDFSSEGLKYARGGEARINWALLRIVDAVNHTLTRDRLDDIEARALTHALDDNITPEGAVTPKRMLRQAVFRQLLAPLRARAASHRPKILKIKLFVYGFSRGAAEARAFINWLTHILDAALLKEATPRPTLLGWPIAVEFLGLCDTVASVGIPRMVPGFRGHLGWADDNLALPDEGRFPGFIRRCCHFISAHEQRLCFPLDSVRRTDGRYPANTLEVIYPGVHSDVGGGYMYGEQGKGVEDALLLSQIVLHDLYAAAFAAGAPLQVPEAVVPPYLLARKPSRIMDEDILKEFDIEQPLIDRFNAWRTTLTGELSQVTSPGYHPEPLPFALEGTLFQQMAWMTGWRIGRFANGSYRHQPFYQAAGWNSGDADPAQRKASEAARNQKQQEREAQRRQNPDTPGVPVFEPACDQLQLQQGADEFRTDYTTSASFMVGMSRERTGGPGQIVIDDLVGKIVYVLDPDDQCAEYSYMKASGEAFSRILFKDPRGSVTDDPLHAQICALYDDHIHDSRAWFMHSTLGFREMWTGYFRYRTLYAGDYSNKQSSLLVTERKKAEILLAISLYYSAAALKETGKQLEKAGAVVLLGMETEAQARQLEHEILMAKSKRVQEWGEEFVVAVKKAGVVKEQARQLNDEIVAARNEFILRKGRAVIRGVVDNVKALTATDICQVIEYDGKSVCQVPVYRFIASPAYEITRLREIYRQRKAAQEEEELDELLEEFNNPVETN